MQKFLTKFSGLATSGCHNSAMITNAENSRPNGPPKGCLVSIFTVRINPDIIYTTLCKMQQIYYIHNVVQMQLISYTQCRQMATLDAPKVLLLTDKTKLTLTVTLTLTDTVTVILLRAFRRHR